MSSAAADAVDGLQERIGYVFRDPGLLERALTHRSFSNEHRDLRSPNNERLEFLGDAVLGFVVGDLIYRAFPNLQEGALSKIKAHLVSATMLAGKGRELNLGRYLRMGAGEARSGGSEKLSLLADAFEALVAAVYLDGGLASAEGLVRRTFMPDVSGIDVGDLSFHDYKTALQETAQGLGLPLPEYRVVDEYGPDHEKCFVVEVFWDGESFAYGKGSSKREAQRKAAKEALKKLGRLPA
ncbi:MAG TPA: ribonuclease III [Thermoanaerobaculia bacterium]|nr:ribonuclease III [Thermoanaerobaculia bacterium]